MRLRHQCLAVGLAFSLPVGLAMVAYCRVPQGGEMPACSYFVAATGSDSNDGMSAKTPFATLKKAQSAARHGNSRVVCLRAGIYDMDSTLTLTAADSGETWQYYAPDGVNSAVLDGGDKSTPSPSRVRRALPSTVLRCGRCTTLRSSHRAAAP